MIASRSGDGTAAGTPIVTTTAIGGTRPPRQPKLSQRIFKGARDVTGIGGCDSGPDHHHLYVGSYSDAGPGWWADRIRERSRAGQDVFVYFNNDGDANAVRNARTSRHWQELAMLCRLHDCRRQAARESQLVRHLGQALSRTGRALRPVPARARAHLEDRPVPGMDSFALPDVPARERLLTLYGLADEAARIRSRGR
jgi:uncharacterized protein DUF72